jgi:hypothetical protein
VASARRKNRLEEQFKSDGVARQLLERQLMALRWRLARVESERTDQDLLALFLGTHLARSISSRSGRQADLTFSVNVSNLAGRAQAGSISSKGVQGRLFRSKPWSPPGDWSASKGQRIVGGVA